MLRRWATEYRASGMSLISLVLVFSFALIPVRCDASTTPHSIFVSPTMLNQVEHQHHARQAADRTETAHTMTHHSPLMIDADSGVVEEHHHTSATDDSPNSGGERSASQLAKTNDPGSQQPLGAMLDLPPASVTAGGNTLPQPEQESDALLFGPAAILRGIIAAPLPPPPKSF